MALIRRADIESYTRDALVMDLDDLEKRGRSVVETANAQAEQIIRDANTERDELLATAQQDGFDKGHQEGHDKGFAEGVTKGIEEARANHAQAFDQLAAMWTAQLDGFESQRDTLLSQARTQVVELGAMIAQRVTRRVVVLDPSVVLNQIEAALSSACESTRFVIAVNPEEIETAREEMPTLIERFATCEHAQVIADPEIERGSCTVRTATGGLIDASISTQLDRILEGILPDGAWMVQNQRPTEDAGQTPSATSEDPVNPDPMLEKIDPKEDAA